MSRDWTLYACNWCESEKRYQGTWDEIAPKIAEDGWLVLTLGDPDATDSVERVYCGVECLISDL